MLLQKAVFADIVRRTDPYTRHKAVLFYPVGNIFHSVRIFPGIRGEAIEIAVVITEILMVPFPVDPYCIGTVSRELFLLDG